VDDRRRPGVQSERDNDSHDSASDSNERLTCCTQREYTNAIAHLVYTCLGTRMTKPGSARFAGDRSARLLDVLDRVLDKGIVMDAWVRMSAAGIDLITMDARVVVASLETYVRRDDLVGRVPWCALPMQGLASSNTSVEQRADTSGLPSSGAVVRAAAEYLRQLP